MKRVLFLAAELPIAGQTGGRTAIHNHLLSLAQTPHEFLLDVVAISDSRDAQATVTKLGDMDITLLAPGLSDWRTPGGMLAAIAQWAFDLRPRAAAHVGSRHGRRWLARRLATERYDAIVVDHAKAWALLKGQGYTGDVTYIAHNLEADIVHDEMTSTRWRSPHRLRLLVEWLKTWNYERGLLARADKVVCISSYDAQVLSRRGVHGQILVWPELARPRPFVDRDWSGKTLLFVGSAGHFPNVEAVRWLANALMPSLKAICPDVRLHVAGCARHDIPGVVDNEAVIFEGFVSNERLDQLHRGSDLFICPVVLGSGIKIKALEAAAYGMPIAASRESLRGIDFLDGVALVIDRDAQRAAALIAQALEDPQGLARRGAETLQALARDWAQRPTLGAVIQAAAHPIVAMP